MDFEHLFLDSLPLIDRRTLAHQHGPPKVIGWRLSRRLAHRADTAEKTVVVEYISLSDRLLVFTITAAGI